MIYIIIYDICDICNFYCMVASAIWEIFSSFPCFAIIGYISNMVIFQNIRQLRISIFQFEYFIFRSFVWYSTVFCNRFAFECFVPNIRLLLNTCTY